MAPRKTRDLRDSKPLIRAIAREAARVLGGRASQHVRRAHALLTGALREMPGRLPTRRAQPNAWPA